MKRNLLILSLAASVAASSQALAQERGNAKKGAELAKTVCAQCHAVRPGENRSPNPVAPAFANVATWPGMTDRALRVWLQTSHPTMPNFILSRKDRDNIAAYILSLNGGSSPT